MPQPSFFLASVYVAAGGAFGSWLRFLVGRGWTAVLGPARAGVFPYGTLTVNVFGSLVMGLVSGWLARLGSAAEGTRLLVAVGILGGFTTFSSMSLDFATLVERGEIGTAAFYTAISLFAGFGGLFLGLFLMRNVA